MSAFTAGLLYSVIEEYVSKRFIGTDKISAIADLRAMCDLYIMGEVDEDTLRKDVKEYLEAMLAGIMELEEIEKGVDRIVKAARAETLRRRAFTRVGRGLPSLV